VWVCVRVVSGVWVCCVCVCGVCVCGVCVWCVYMCVCGVCVREGERDRSNVDIREVQG